LTLSGGGNDLRALKVGDKLSDKDKIEAQWLKDSAEYPPVSRYVCLNSARSMIVPPAALQSSTNV
jgi:hypothetical protein